MDVPKTLNQIPVKTKWKFLGFSLVVLMFAVVALDLGEVWSYGGQRSATIDGNLKITYLVDTRIERYGILGLTVFSRSKLPFDIKVMLFQEPGEIQKLQIDELLVIYPNGDTNTIQQVPSVATVRPYRYTNYNSKDGLQHHEEERFSAEFSGAVKRAENFTIQCRGVVVKKNGIALPFTNQIDLQIESFSGLKWYVDGP